MAKTVFVVGAGPAGLFAAQKIALAGHNVVIFNRDIKPGGLAEYGIYVVKEKMKSGLRKQFAKVLSLPNVQYFGHVMVGNEQPLKLEDLRALNPAAVVCTNGAQGTKKLGLPGENARGVYAAKDFVFYFNNLPPFATQDFSTGKRVAVVGMGNVAVDIMRWLLEDCPNRQTEEVVVVARRGPFEAKFDEKEFKHVEMYLERAAFEAELARVAPKIAACDQDISKISEATFPCLKRDIGTQKPVLKFRFLSSPKEIIAGPDGRMCKLVVTENDLVKKGEGTAAKGTDKTTVLDIDSMIFAIGDVHDPKFGLPMGPDGFNTVPDPADPKKPTYAVVDPATGKPMPGYFVAGWARRASDGLVGIARHDAEVAADSVLKYVESVPETAVSTAQVEKLLQGKGVTYVSKADLTVLGKAEEAEAAKRGLPSFKWGDDETMLQVVGKGKAKSANAD
jgi:ferredoxin/flavodoxin---NADP+ reductase